ncbi:MAG TPA: Coq4 family protein [Polyangia bacterium]|jgi:ubiquinone biosynthesis protein COQ4
MVFSQFRFEPARAWRAARKLAADPDDLPQVFTLIESLSGYTLIRLGWRLKRSEEGRRLLAQKSDIVARLADRAALARLPAGSLGRAYLEFVERENISADGIRAAAEKGMTQESPPPAPLDYVHARMRDTHDLWHAAVGYHGDVLGETALLAFTLAQTWNPAIALIIGIGLVKLRARPEVRPLILDGFRRGRRAAWLPEQDWESLLALPVDEVRRRLSLESPPVYTPIRSVEVKAQAQAQAA